MSLPGAIWPGRLGQAVPDRRPLTLLVLAQLVIGVAIGLAWLAWSPTSVSYLLDSGNGTGIVVPAESEAQVAADGRYALLTVLAGLLFGLLAWRQRSNRGPVTLVVLAVSSLVSSLLALAAGQLLSDGEHGKALNTAFHPPLVLHAAAAIFLQPLFAVLIYTVFVGLSGDQQLGRDPHPVEPAAQPPDGGSVLAAGSVAAGGSITADGPITGNGADGAAGSVAEGGGADRHRA